MPTLKLTAIFLVALVTAFTGSALALEPGEAFPDVSALTLEGESFQLGQLKGLPALIKIGTTWCPSCREQSAEIDKIRNFIDSSNIRYVEVFVDEKSAAVEKFFAAADHQRPHIILLDQGEMSRALNIYLIPRVLLVDADHTVFYDGDTLNTRELKKQLQEMLTGNQNSAE